VAIPIGIDPASGKETCFWIDNDFAFVKAKDVRSTLQTLLEKYPSCMIAWDAPISFSRKSFSDRQIDRVARAWIKEKVMEGRLEKSSVNALPFSGLSHWVISCEALGLPFGKTLTNLKLYQEHSFGGDAGQFLVEVHPAVSMACSWLDIGIQEPFPVYKKSKEARRSIVENLGFPEACIESDDVLDAYVAYLMAESFLAGKSSSLCRPEYGSYVLPNGKAFDELSGRVRK
jgi:predicted nuclease with RNAse H fold